MEIRGYKRIKKKDIRRWFKGSNLILYILILLLLFALIMFAYRTIVGMHNENVDNEQNQQMDETDNSDDITSSSESTTYIAKNQSYRIKINVSKNIAVISYIDANNSNDNGKTVRAFHIATNKDIKTGSTVISEKSEWRKLDNNGYAHYSSRLENMEYICSTAYFTRTIGNMNIDEYNKIGTSVTYGSIFMTPADAKWIYNNCGINTSVEILSDFDIPTDANITEFKKYNYIDKLEE